VQGLIEGGAKDGVGGPEDLPGWDTSFGWGRVDAFRSILLLKKGFIRGDVNADGGVDLSDPIDILVSLLLDPTPFPCASAADANDDGQVDLTDAISLLQYLFLSGALPDPSACGFERTFDDLTCSEPCR
jgi:hypothetical protein